MIANLPNGAAVTVYGEWNGWYVVQYGDQVGYAAAAYIYRRIAEKKRAGCETGVRFFRKDLSKISSAEEEGRRIVNEAIRNAESKKKEALLEAKEEILKSRTDYEKEEKSRRADLQRQENRLQQKEENLDRKTGDH